MKKANNCLLNHFNNKHKLATNVNSSGLNLYFLSSLEEIVKHVTDVFKFTKITPQLDNRSWEMLDNKLNMLLEVRDFCATIRYILKHISKLISNLTTHSKLKENEHHTRLEQRY